MDPKECFIKGSANVLGKDERWFCNLDSFSLRFHNCSFQNLNPRKRLSGDQAVAQGMESGWDPEQQSSARQIWFHCWVRRLQVCVSHRQYVTVRNEPAELPEDFSAELPNERCAELTSMFLMIK